MSKITHWGEIPSPIVDEDSGIAAIERAEIMKTRELHHHGQQSSGWNCFKGSKQANESDEKLMIPLGDPIMMHSIQLMKFINECECSLSSFTIQSQSPSQSPPSIPAPPVISTNSGSNNLLSVPNCDVKDVKRMLRRSVICISNYHGYDFANESVLDLLVDVTSHYMQRISCSLRVSRDSYHLRSSHDFIDLLNRCLNEIGLSDIHSLRKFFDEMKMRNMRLQTQARNTLKRINPTASNQSVGSNNLENGFLLHINDSNSNGMKEEVKREIDYDSSSNPPSASFPSPFDAPKTNLSMFACDTP